MEHVFNNSVQTVFNACLTTLNKLEMEIQSKDITSGTIQARTKGTWRSWGEDIVIHIFDFNNKTKIVVNSTASAQLFTWGKNDENEEEIINCIKNLLSE